jgi:hypothetical protein
MGEERAVPWIYMGPPPPCAQGTSTLVNHVAYGLRVAVTVELARDSVAALTCLAMAAWPYTGP